MGDQRNYVLKMYQLNTAKATAAGNALARIMGAQRHSLAFITEPPIHGAKPRAKVCGFTAAAFNVFHNMLLFKSVLNGVRFALWDKYYRPPSFHSLVEICVCCFVLQNQIF